MSRSSDMITHTTWPSVHISFCLAIHSSPSLHLFSLTLSSSLHHPHLFFTPCVILLSLPTTPPISTSLIACYSPLSFSLSPMCLHHFFTSPSVLSEKPLELAAPEFWSATLWSKKPRQTAFPINQYFQWLWLTPVTSALHGGKCSVLEQNSKHLTYPGYSQILLIAKHFTYWADKFSEIRNMEVPLALSFRSLVHFEWVNKWVSEGVSECWFFFKKAYLWAVFVSAPAPWLPYGCVRKTRYTQMLW